MQRRISQAFPAAIFSPQSGSVNNGRPSATISAIPLSMTRSAILASIIRPTALTGTFTAFLMFPAISTKNPYGCTPIGGIVSAILPVWFACATWNISTPSSSNHFANSTASSSSIPPLPRCGVTIESL